LQAQAPNWGLDDDAHRIERTFRFRNFWDALALVQEIGELAETEGRLRRSRFICLWSAAPRASCT
jgi:pterin-4a-carbinolamine dehydratase